MHDYFLLLMLRQQGLRAASRDRLHDGGRPGASGRLPGALRRLQGAHSQRVRALMQPQAEPIAVS